MDRYSKRKIRFVFKEFLQLSEGLNRKYEGIGLGLTISKRKNDRKARRENEYPE